MTILVRKLTKDDHKHIWELYEDRGLWYPKGDAAIRSRWATLHRELVSRRLQIWVAADKLAGDIPLGLVVAVMLKAFHGTEQCELRIIDLYVRKAYDTASVREMLLQAVMKTAIAEKARKVSAAVSLDQAEMFRIYGFDPPQDRVFLEMKTPWSQYRMQARMAEAREETANENSVPVCEEVVRDENVDRPDSLRGESPESH